MVTYQQRISCEGHSIVVWFILISSWVHHSHICFSLEGAILIWIWPITNFFWDIGALPNRKAPIWTSSCKIDINNVLPLEHRPFQLIYMGVELWAKPYGIKLRCYYWKHLEGQLGNLRNLVGTSWEHIGNNRKKRFIRSAMENALT
jgi:hypothetical protein